MQPYKHHVGGSGLLMQTHLIGTVQPIAATLTHIFSSLLDAAMHKPQGNAISASQNTQGQSSSHHALSTSGRHWTASTNVFATTSET